ncbi:tRNA adenosine(34) deaminase TadA [Candidatus Berkiella cookevillensis]|uniref:tRNA-specific adenosine deaminase n=1 Tax=Candidatus Berkiella cookevillensis TaxID=437022 RepID=A0A0Q9YVQ4_9GAMM|nr:tRNA adenosine(34) deaminase TadA [Candidatus Berkiella cookevillensis]MCS5708255.1 tRNA adenosine(34) deaminase TadA [Candidatus Berkiella cookevillensis]
MKQQLEQDIYWMQRALELAKQGQAQGEVPVGAVLIQEDTELAAEYNTPISHNDPTCHAEMNVIRKAATRLQNYRLLDTTLYVTLEPCCMCAGAIIQARIKRVVFGAFDLKAGASGSVINILSMPQLNHHPEIVGGILKESCGSLLTEFFKKKRLKRIERCCD